MDVADSVTGLVPVGDPQAAWLIKCRCGGCWGAPVHRL